MPATDVSLAASDDDDDDDGIVQQTKHSIRWYAEQKGDVESWVMWSPKRDLLNKIFKKKEFKKNKSTLEHPFLAVKTSVELLQKINWYEGNLHSWGVF